MPREIEWHPHFAWLPVLTEDGKWAWLRWVERRKWWVGPRTTKIGDPDLMVWHYRDAGHGGKEP
jgi:hypothetical protein